MSDLPSAQTACTNAQKKAMTDLSSAYIAKEFEPKWRDVWEQSGAFHANPDSEKPPFCVMMPPPNVTGTLHMGHALVSTIQDILTRWKKMTGHETLWMPGTDHAGIATQTVVERNLLKQYGKHRCEFSREEFLKHVWDWKEKSQGIILNQIRAIGCACDWSRLRFSMDEQCSKAVRHMFKKLFDHGLIYRGNYLVNWDCISGTALADDEVEYEDRQGYLWTIRYPIVGENQSIFVATTRPETMLGDTAVAVHPHDERYKQYIGKTVDHPITGRKLPIVADEFVDPSFGTGVVKITPAHDPNDYALAQRRNLPMINIITKDGKISEEGGPFVGMSVPQAREAVLEELKRLNVLVKIEPHRNRVGVSYRSKAVIEPLLSQQWFVRLSAFKDVLKDYVITKKVALIPSTWEHTYFQWIDNLRDWCISRQLWWGHRIPVWYNRENPEIFICYEGTDLPEEVQKNPSLWEQDADVLDTWFSSALWPLSTLGWPEKTPEFDKFFPTSTLITGHDIIFFWVARMIMMSHFATGKQPFDQTFLHGLIYGKSYFRTDSKVGVVYAPPEEKKLYDIGKTSIPNDVQTRWEKMSKSKGNVIDPMEIIDEYGADAMRLALASVTTHASIIELDRRRFEEFQHFINKLWNAARFVISKISSEELPLTDITLQTISLSSLPLEDRWILSKLERTTTLLNSALTAYEFDKAITILYEFFWNDFCSLYIEVAKSGLQDPKTRPIKQTCCAIVLLNTLKLLHPFAPFITEELFKQLKCLYGHLDSHACASPEVRQFLSDLASDLICLTSYPNPSDRFDMGAEEGFSTICSVLTSIRAIRGEMKIAPNVLIDVFVVGTEKSATMALIREQEALLSSLVKISSISYTISSPHLHQLTSTTPVGDCLIVIPLPKELQEQEIARLNKNIDKLRISIERSKTQYEKVLSSGRTPPEIIEKMKNGLTQQESELKLLSEQLEKMLLSKQ